jgi:WD repeat-containing protein 1 (actin-interacting protein 1)
MLCSDDTGKVRVWSWDNPEHQLKVEVPVFSGKIIDLDWDPESKRIVAVGDGKTLSAKCFMWDTGNSVGEMIGHSKRISTVSYKGSRPFRIMTVSCCLLLLVVFKLLTFEFF